MSILKKDVPDYLRASPFYENVFQSDDDSEHTVDIPADCLKSDPTVQTLADLRSLLKTIRFWLIPEYIETSSDVFEIVLNNIQCLASVLPDYGEDIPFLLKLNAVLQLDGQLTHMGKAAKHGLLGFIRHLRSKSVKWETGVTMNFPSIAASHGHLDCLMYATENGCKLHEDICALAATNGHVSCLKYAYEQGASISYATCEAAVKNGHLGCVEYLVRCKADLFLKYRSLFQIACRQGKLEIISYLLSITGLTDDVRLANAAVAFDQIACLKLLVRIGCPFSKDTLYIAVHCGAIECVKYLHKLGCSWSEDTILISRNDKARSSRGILKDAISLDALRTCFLYAALHRCPVYPATYVLATDIDSLELMKLLKKHNVRIERDAAHNAIARHNINCLQYLLEVDAPAGAHCYVLAVHYKCVVSLECLYVHGVEMCERATEQAVTCNYPEILRFLLVHGCPADGAQLMTMATKNDKRDCLKILHEHGIPMTQVVVLEACKAQAIQCLKYALSNGCSYTAEMCVMVAEKGYTNCLKCLHEHGAPMTMEVYNTALQADKFECVAFAVVHGLSEMGQEACVAAASYKWFSNLQQLHVSGASWDINTCLTAVRSGSFECLKYAVKNGCPVDVTVLAEAALCNDKTTLKWLHKKGIAWDASVTAAAVKSDSVECLKYAIQWHCPYDVAVEVLERSPKCLFYMLGRGNWVVERARERHGAKKALSSEF